MYLVPRRSRGIPSRASTSVARPAFGKVRFHSVGFSGVRLSGLRGGGGGDGGGSSSRSLFVHKYNWYIPGSICARPIRPLAPRAETAMVSYLIQRRVPNSTGEVVWNNCNSRGGPKRPLVPGFLVTLISRCFIGTVKHIARSTRCV